MKNKNIYRSLLLQSSNDLDICQFSKTVMLLGTLKSLESIIPKFFRSSNLCEENKFDVTKYAIFQVEKFLTDPDFQETRECKNNTFEWNNQSKRFMQKYYENSRFSNISRYNI